MKKLGLISVAALMASGAAAWADELSVVCSAEQDWCDLMVSAFEAENPDTDVLMVRKSTGETLAQIRAEAGNPKIDVWWGGTGDPHLIAAEEGLTQPSGVDTSELLGWAQNMADISEGRAIGIYAGALGIAYNSEILAEKNIASPECWADLEDPRFIGEIQVANPNSSGTAYTELATFVQLFGEDEAMLKLAAVGLNVNSSPSLVLPRPRRRHVVKRACPSALCTTWYNWQHKASLWRLSHHAKERATKWVLCLSSKGRATLKARRLGLNSR